MPKIRTKRVAPPEGFDVVEPVLQELETKMREAEVAPHEGKRKSESLWPIIRIHHQRSRYVYEMFYKRQEISREVYDYCLREGYADGNLIAKWKKPGLDSLCCLGCAQTKDHNYGTACICRIPRTKLDAGRAVECTTCGCRGCASGDDKFALIDVAATVEARGGLPPRQGYGGGAPPPARDTEPQRRAEAAAPDQLHPSSSSSSQPPALLAAAAATAAASAPPGFFPPLPPAMMHAMMAQLQQQMAAAAAAAAAGATGALPPPGWPPQFGGLPPMGMPPLPFMPQAVAPAGHGAAPAGGSAGGNESSAPAQPEA